MTKFLTLLMVTLMNFALLAPVADAKRLGGGKSFGMQRDNIGQQAAPRAPSQAQNPGAAGGAAAPAAGNRWQGPIAGLAAGGQLAAMFMGGAFDANKPFDIVQLLGIAALIIFIIRAMRARAPAAAHTMQNAGHGLAERIEEAQGYQDSGTSSGAAPIVNQVRPAWFVVLFFLCLVLGLFFCLLVLSVFGVFVVF